MDKDLHRYLQGHLSGSHGALPLIRELATRQTDTDEAAFFRRLELKVLSDLGILEKLLASVAHGEGEISPAADCPVGRQSRLVFLYEGMKPEKVGTFEALEMLALGIQGKRLLWVALQQIAHYFPEWSGTDFQALEFDAIRQREAVEDRRQVQGSRTLACPLRTERSSNAPAA